MKISKRLLKQAEKLADLEDKGEKLNRKQRRIVEAATKKLDK